MNLRELAEGQPCLIRLPGVCNHNKQTTVLCHFRCHDLSGFGLKADDWFGAWGCSDCHIYVDTHHDDETQYAFAQAVFRTQHRIIHEHRGILLVYFNSLK